MDEFIMKLQSGKSKLMTADFNASNRHKMYEFKRNNLF